jgi:hypothetical protein
MPREVRMHNSRESWMEPQGSDAVGLGAFLFHNRATMKQNLEADRLRCISRISLIEKQIQAEMMHPSKRPRRPTIRPPERSVVEVRRARYASIRIVGGETMAERHWPRLGSNAVMP